MNTKRIHLRTGIEAIDKIVVYPLKTMATGYERFVAAGNDYAATKDGKLYTTTLRPGFVHDLSSWKVERVVRQMRDLKLIDDAIREKFQKKRRREVLDVREKDRLKRLRAEARGLGYKLVKRK